MSTEKRGPLRKFLDEWEPILPRKKIIESERLKTILRYYEPIPEAPPLIPSLKRKELKRSNPDGLREYTLIELFEGQKKGLEATMKLIREGVEKCDPKTLRASLLAKSFINGLQGMLLGLKDTVPEHIYREEEEWIEKTDAELFNLSEKYGKICRFR